MTIPVFCNKIPLIGDIIMKINILLENHSVDAQYKTKHGLSLLIEYNGNGILLDTGPDIKFAENADKMNIDLTKVNYLFLSHNHNDHTGGINKFIEINDTAPVFLMDSIDNNYYLKLFFFYKSIGLKLYGKNRSRIIQVTDDLIIDDKIFFLRNIYSEYKKPIINKKLYKKDNNRKVNDTFNHEGILVLNEDNELAVFNSCSHNGILNVIETVKAKIPNKKIRSYVGGLHLFSPRLMRGVEYNKYLDYLISELKRLDMVIYTGHCTGKYALDRMKEKLGNKVQEINTGMELGV